jgi:hypothetical protein
VPEQELSVPARLFTSTVLPFASRWISSNEEDLTINLLNANRYVVP